MRIEDAKRRISDAVKRYDERLNNKQLLIIYGDSNNPEFLEVKFRPQHFKHLTGIVPKGNLQRAKVFYKHCIDGKLTINDFNFDPNGTSVFKLDILQKLMYLDTEAKMFGRYDNSMINLETDYLAGGVHAVMGFIHQPEEKCYVPNTVLKKDIRNISKETPKKVLAVLKKSISDTYYSNITCPSNAKIAEFGKIKLSTELKKLIKLPTKV